MLANFLAEQPSLTETERQDRRITLAMMITRVTLWITLGLSGIMFVSWLLMRQYTQILIYALVIAVMGVMSWTYPIFIKKGWSTFGGALYLGWFLILTAVCLFLIPEMIAGVMVCYVFVTLLSNIFLGYRGFVAFMAASLILFAVNMVYLYHPEAYWFEALPFSIGPILGTLAGGVAFGVLSIYVRKIMVSQEDSFAASQEAKQEIEKKVSQEQARRRLLQQTVTDYLEMMTAVGQGNLAVRIPVDSNANVDEDPLVALGLVLNQTIASLEMMIHQIGEAASNLSSASAEILSATTQQASGSSEQSAAISQTTTTVQEVRSIAEQAVERAQEVVTAAQQTADVSINGKRSIQETIEGMHLIRERVESIASNILALSEQTQQIGEIITSVNDLASQSNMLALNAAVEAARAGEQGKGFSVVAAEVRSLSIQSKQATAQVKSILQEIQKATNASVMSTEEGIKVVAQGVQLAGKTQETIEQLIAVINESVNRMMQVMAGGHQQATGMEQVTMAMVNIQQASLQSLASTRQAEKSAQDLNQLALRLNRTMAKYERKDGAHIVDFALARLNHKNWIKRLISFMDGKEPMTEAGVVSHTDCDLGKWLYSTALPKYGSNAEIQELERIHQEFHTGVKRVVRLKTDGEAKKAENELATVQKITDRIFTLLSVAEKREAGVR